jgi:hypothetical protein
MSWLHAFRPDLPARWAVMRLKGLSAMSTAPLPPNESQSPAAGCSFDIRDAAGAVLLRRAGKDRAQLQKAGVKCRPAG